MTVESATYINTLNGSLPTSTDAKAEGDDHIRLVKTVLQTTFPNITAAVTASAAGLNAASAVSSSGTFPGVPVTGVTALTIAPSSGSAALLIERATLGTGQNTLNFVTVADSTATWQVFQQTSSKDLSFFSSNLGATALSLSATTGAVLVNQATTLFPQAGRANVELSGTSESLVALNINGAPASYVQVVGTALNIQNSLSGAINLGTNGSTRMTIAAGGAVSTTGALAAGGALSGTSASVVGGTLSGTALHNNATPLTGTTTQYVGSGTYTPATTLVTNVVTATPAQCQWTRVGNVVTVSGALSTVTLNASINISRIGISLPIASTLSSSANLAGTGAGVDNGPANIAGRISGDTTNNRAEFLFVAGSSTSFSTTGGMSFSFTYVVL